MWITAGVSKFLDWAASVAAHVSAGLIIALMIMSVIPPAMHVASKVAESPAGNVPIDELMTTAIYLFIVLMFYWVSIKILTEKAGRVKIKIRRGRVKVKASPWGVWRDYSPWRFVAAIVILYIAGIVKSSLFPEGPAGTPPELNYIENGVQTITYVSLFIGMTVAFINTALGHAHVTPPPPPPKPSPKTYPKPQTPNPPKDWVTTSPASKSVTKSSWRDTVDSILREPVPGLKGWGRARRVSGPYAVSREVTNSFKGLGNVDGLKCWLIGCGGWGCVYECMPDSGVDRVALKIHRSFRGLIEGSERVVEVPTAPESVIRRIRSEVDALRSVRHPNLIELRGYSLLVPAVIYEFVSGASLKNGLSRLKGDLRSVIMIGIQAGDALRYLHSRGLVHRDLKPSNVLVTSQGYVKVGDYSSVRRLIEASTSTAGTLCTPGYCAPEQVFSDLAAKAYEAGMENRVDIYQLGNLMLEALTGEIVDGEEAVKNPGRLTNALSRVSNKGLRDLLKSMLNPNPLNRPSAEEVVKELASLISG